MLQAIQGHDPEILEFKRIYRLMDPAAKQQEGYGSVKEKQLISHLPF
jgi:hypothetical protein